MSTKHAPPGKDRFGPIQYLAGPTSSRDLHTPVGDLLRSHKTANHLGCHSPGRRGRQATCTKIA